MIKSIGSLTEYVAALGEYDDATSSVAIYRGTSSADHPLVPRLGRLQGFSSAKLDENEERTMLDLFRKQAAPYLDHTPENDWEWVALAHQSGVPTRLLDWTRNPLVAAFFALETETETDSAIHVFTSKIVPLNMIADKPFGFKHALTMVPPRVSLMTQAQATLYTVHPNPREPFESEFLDKLVIPQTARIGFKRDLYKLGIHKASVSPGLAGLAAHIRWLRTDEY